MKKRFLVAMMSVALVGCGGSDNGASHTPDVEQTPSLTRVSGRIEQVSGRHIVVNGRDYSVNAVMYRDESLAVNVLQPNMQVELSPALSKQEQMNVLLEPSMAGRIEAIDHHANSFVINGLALHFDELSDELEVGDWVMVSSLPTVNAGYKVLSVIEIDVDDLYPNLANVYEIEGRVASVDSNHASFMLGQLQVDYSGAYALPYEGIKVGQWLEVEGEMQGDVFYAYDVELDSFDFNEGQYEAEGIVTWVANDTSRFSLSYRGDFIIDSRTQFEDGSKSQLKQGAEVEVDFRVQGGERIATKIEFENAAWDDAWAQFEFECEGLASVFDEQTQSFTVSYCENGADKPLSNKQVFVDAQTRFYGISSDTLNGARIEVEGVIINGQNMAREIERD